MKVFSEGLTPGWVVGKFRPPQFTASFFLKGAFAIKADAVAALEKEPAQLLGDIHFEGDVSRGLLYASDFAPFKPRADVLLTGTAYAPGGQPSASFSVRMRVGGILKTLDVIGRRLWHRGFFGSRPGQPHPITKLELSYENAWGGGKYKKNPVGRGRVSEEMHNIDLAGARVRSRRASPQPAGFGPLSASWEPRKNMVGSYKGKWLKERWPWFPLDFDWGYFNAAPRDQQVEGYLRGDEELEFENLRPDRPTYRSRLPGLRARCFINERLPDDKHLFREVPLKLDTLWIDLNTEKLILVWRGLTNVRTIKLSEVEQFFAMTEPLAEPSRSLLEYQTMLEERFLRNVDPVASAKEAEAEATRQAAFDKRFSDMAKEIADMDKEVVKMEAEAQKTFADQIAGLISSGIDPKLLEMKTPMSLQDTKAAFEASISEISERNPEYSAQIKGLDFPDCERIEMEMAAFEKRMEALRPIKATRELVQKGIDTAAGGELKRFAGQDLSGLDLSGLNLSGADLSGARLVKTKLSKAKLVRANLSRANLIGADLTEADFTGATLLEADLTLADLSGAKLTDMALEDATLSGLNLEGADFSGCQGKRADFSNANLLGARFVGAKLRQANFSGAKLERAVFNLAELQAAQFDGAKAAGVQMEGADISGLHGGGKADFRGGNFRQAKGENSIWEQSDLNLADFSRAILTRANFNESSLRGSLFDRAIAVKASFEDADLESARFTNANLLRATFARANLAQADLANSNMFETGFWETIFHQTNVEGANVRRTLIS